MINELGGKPDERESGPVGDLRTLKVSLLHCNYIQWTEVGKRNEALDTLVYSFGAIYILNPNFDVIEQKILDVGTEKPRKTKNPNKINIKRGNFATNWK